MAATRILMGILIGMGGLSLIILIVQLFKIKIWVYEKGRRGPKKTKIGFLNTNNDYEVPEVHLPDKAKGTAIGRIKMGEKDDNAYVELLLTDHDDETEKAKYHTYGFISQEGWIYKLGKKNRNPQKIGYTARPSNPNEPTSIGERTWKTLWLKCTLNAYLGFPDKPIEELQPTERTNEPEKQNPEETNIIPEPTPEDNNALTSENQEDIELENTDEIPGQETEEIKLAETIEIPDKAETVKEEEIKESVQKEPESTEIDLKKPLRLEKKKDKNTKEKKLKKTVKQAIAVATYTGIHSSRKDPIPPEARAAAFGVFFNQYNKKNYQEHYNTPGYGWKDTALLAAFIYTVLYCIWYIFNVKLLGLKFIGYKFWQDIPLYFAFYALWVIVRAIKIECIERSDTIQPKIDLFNKTLGQKWFDILIIVCCAITLAFSPKYYRFDFIPLAAVLITAFSINFSLKANKKPWKMDNPLDTEEETEEDELENPRGDIERHYEWVLDSPDFKNVEGQLALYFDARYISDLRFMNPFFSQRKDKALTSLIKEMFTYQKSHKSVSARTRYIVKKIQEISRQRGLNSEDTLQFTLDFVQEPNIRFVMNRDSDSILKFEDYIRYPDEVLYDKESDSNSKAFLAAMLVHYLKYDVLFLYSRLQQHGAIGIRIPKEWENKDKLFGLSPEDILFTHNGKKYVFCETTADGFRIGGTMGGMKHSDFDERIELPVVEVESDETNEDTDTKMYNWDLDSEEGKQLHGNYTLEFSEDEIEQLRADNPFVNYGKDGKSYEDNVKYIFQYLDQEPERRSKVKEIASYIKSSAKKAELSSLETVQFALDFCQAPNITYKIDEDCDNIPYNEVSKEYMRFPDEVLYDKEGDCDCKSSLTVALFREMGYKTLFMMSKKLGHAAVAIEYNPEWKYQIKDLDENRALREHNGVNYIYCETTSDGHKVGHINEGDSIYDFETVVEL